jgi:hypothetical protein
MIALPPAAAAFVLVAGARGAARQGLSGRARADHLER